MQVTLYVETLLVRRVKKMRKMLAHILVGRCQNIVKSVKAWWALGALVQGPWMAKFSSCKIEKISKATQC